MIKVMKIVDRYTGEIMLSQEFDGDFQFQFTSNPDSGKIHTIGLIDNGKFGDKWWIKNYQLRPIAEKLVRKFEELKHIVPTRILFLENIVWTPSGPVPKKNWVARIGKASQWLQDTWGYGYVLEIKQYYMEQMSKEQLIATIYHELRHIDIDGLIKPHDIEDWDNMVATLGTNWVTTKAEIINILDDEFPGWNELRRTGQQRSIFDAPDNVVSINKASKAMNGEMN